MLKKEALKKKTFLKKCPSTNRTKLRLFRLFQMAIFLTRLKNSIAEIGYCQQLNQSQIKIKIQIYAYWIAVSQIMFEKLVELLINMSIKTRLLTRPATILFAHIVAQLKLQLEIERLQFGLPLEPELLQMKQLERISLEFGHH